MKVYSTVLEKDGEMLIATVNPCEYFDIDKYDKNIRNIIFKDFYILDQDIRTIVMSIDDMIKKCNIKEEIEEEDYIELTNLYFNLIQSIKNKIEETAR